MLVCNYLLDSLLPVFFWAYGLLGHMEFYVDAFVELPYYFIQWLFTCPPAMHKVSNFSTSSPALILHVYFSDNSLASILLIFFFLELLTETAVC